MGWFFRRRFKRSSEKGCSGFCYLSQANSAKSSSRRSYSRIRHAVLFSFSCRIQVSDLQLEWFSFSDDLKHCLLSRSPKSALRRTDGRRVPCRFLRRRCRRFSTVCLYKKCQNDSGLIPISFRDLINDPFISTSPVVEAA